MHRAFKDRGCSDDRDGPSDIVRSARDIIWSASLFSRATTVFRFRRARAGRGGDLRAHSYALAAAAAMIFDGAGKRRCSSTEEGGRFISNT